MALDFSAKPQKDHPLDALIEEARMAASRDWEEAFVADIIYWRKHYGPALELTDKQIAKLEDIASGGKQGSPL